MSNTFLDQLLVDAAAGRSSFKLPVRTRATTNQALTGLRIIGGVTLLEGDPVLLTAQTKPAQNGIWLARAGAWVRRSDADSSGKVQSGLTVYVAEGDDAGSWWTLRTAPPIRLDSTALSFSLSLMGSAASVPQLATLSFSFSDVAVASTRTVLNFPDSLPAGARILSVNVKLAERFVGGGATQVVLLVGSAGDDDALVFGADIKTSPVDGQASSVPAGIAPTKHFSGAVTLLCTVLCDVNLNLLTSGRCTVEVTFWVSE